MRAYACGIGEPVDEKANKELLDIISIKGEAKEKLSKEKYGELVIKIHNHMREKYGLSNKMFVIEMNKERTKARLLYFDKEPDGKCYKVFAEEREDGYCPYIEVTE